VVSGVTVHQQTGDDQAGTAAEAQRPGQYGQCADDCAFGQRIAQDGHADRI
jgi:hypothetical protein